MSKIQEGLTRAICELLGSHPDGMPEVMVFPDRFVDMLEMELGAIARFGSTDEHGVARIMFRGVEIKRASDVEGERRELMKISSGEYVSRRRVNELCGEILQEKLSSRGGG